MRGLRTALGTGAASALAGGYAASQWAYLQGDSAAYAALVDRPVVKIVALLVAAAAVVSSFIKDKDAMVKE